MSRFTVKDHRPVQWSSAIVILSMLMAMITWFLLDKSHWSLIYDRLADNREFANVWEANTALKKENLDLHEQVLMMERTAGMDKETMALMQDEVKAEQDEVYRLKGELEFYQGIMDATRDTIGLKIQGIHIEPLAQAHSYRFKLVLTHVAKNVKMVEGTMAVSFEGLHDGMPRQLKLQDITLDESLGLSFKFRHFKRFECNLELPEGFVPRRVLVQLQPKGRNQSMIKKVFDWPEITS